MYQRRPRADGCYYMLPLCRGKVIGEFVCDEIERIVPDYNPVLQKFFYGYVTDISPTCLREEELQKYAGIEPLYFWHISDLVIYDKPKKLGEFRKPCKCEERGEEPDCFLCSKSGYTPDMQIDCFNTVEKPPQSWCYIEEL